MNGFEKVVRRAVPLADYLRPTKGHTYPSGGGFDQYVRDGRTIRSLSEDLSELIAQGTVLNGHVRDARVAPDTIGPLAKLVSHADSVASERSQGWRYCRIRARPSTVRSFALATANERRSASAERQFGRGLPRFVTGHEHALDRRLNVSSGQAHDHRNVIERVEDAVEHPLRELRLGGFATSHAHSHGHTRPICQRSAHLSRLLVEVASVLLRAVNDPADQPMMASAPSGIPEGAGPRQ